MNSIELVNKNETVEKEIPFPEQRKKTLNEIMADYHDLEEMLIDSEGEITKPIEAFMDWCRDNFETKMDGYADFISYLKGQIEYHKNIEKQFEKRRKTLENTIKGLRERMIYAMDVQEFDKLKTQKHSFSLRLTESIHVDESKLEDSKSEWNKESLVSQNWAEFVFKPILTQIKNDFKDKEYPDWVITESKKSITIR